MDRPISFASRSVDLASELPFELGRARVDPQAHEYVVHGKSTHLQPQTLKVLVALHERLGEVVTRDELIDRCWNGRIVGDDVINRCISLLRPVTAESGAYRIETIPRSGYRLVKTAEAREVAVRRLPVRVTGIAAAVLLVTGGAAIYALTRPADLHRTLVVDVMPFVAQPGSHAEQLASDTQDSVVRLLNQSGLSVRTGADVSKDSADMIVSGSVGANAQGDFASIRLEDARRHAVVLSRRLDSDLAHAADLPDRVGANFAAALSWTGPLILMDDRSPSDPAFIDQLLNEPTNKKFDEMNAFEFARRNAPNAPNSPVAQLALAMDTGFMARSLPPEQRAAAIAQGRHGAELALKLAPGFGDVYIPWCVLHASVLMKDCEDHLRAGLVADPQAPFVASFLTVLMNEVGRQADAASLADASFAADRFVPEKLAKAIGLAEATEDRQKADEIYREAERLWPHDASFFWWRAQGILQRGDFAALNQYELAAGTDDLARHSRAGLIATALKSSSIPQLNSACPETLGGFAGVECMIAFAEAGNIDGALAFASRLYPTLWDPSPAKEEAIWLTDPDGTPLAFLTIPAMAPVRRDPRFIALARRVGLLDYWQSGRLPDFCTKAHEPECAQITAHSSVRRNG